MAFPFLPGSSLQRVFLQKCSSPKLTIKLSLHVCVRACVCEREERARRGRERKQYNSLAMWGGIGELLDQRSWLRDASPLLWAQCDPIGSWAAGLKQRRARRIELHSQTQTLSQVVSTLRRREARTHEIAGCPQLDIHLFPERRKGEGIKKNNNPKQKRVKEPDPVQQSQGE